MEYPQTNSGDQPLQQGEQCSVSSCTPGETVGEMVTKDISKAAVFTKYGIDFCCGGKKTLRQACYEKQLDYNQVMQDLSQSGQLLHTANLPYHQWPLDFLAEYIVNVHHNYTREKLPELSAYASRVESKHAGKNPELAEIRSLVTEIALELGTHLQKEENVLFPMITQLSKAAISHGPAPRMGMGIEHPVSRMILEHEQAGAILQKIRELTNNFTPPEYACITWKVFYQTLVAFEADLHVHIHLENNILFPGALKLVNAQ
ncbi:iron-sulfur cluster repair di-iron protein [Pseudoflavitalea rhizosphaerae]|uniref:iron-sulfur cluster repair di-iron protein n=1 Tax=Pseudoflavitalea rhizosphaerae TaxID=1884793 RepID=UPI000F8CE631|nr:iron-sulfur cluster repair di-iron protein [Pseudoflavitalea rhizosphaerae]